MSTRKKTLTAAAKKKLIDEHVKQYRKHLEQQAEIHAGSFWDDFQSGFTSVLESPITKAVVPLAISALAGNIARVNHHLGLQKMTKEEEEYYKKNHHKHIQGEGFWDDFQSGFASVFESPITKAVLPIAISALAAGNIDDGSGYRTAGSYRTAGKVRVAGAYRTGGEESNHDQYLGRTEASRPPKHLAQRRMNPNDYA